MLQSKKEFVHGLLNRKDLPAGRRGAKDPQSPQGFLIFLKILFNLCDPCAFLASLR
jgi:hypothetical protein